MGEHADNAARMGARREARRLLLGERHAAAWSPSASDRAARRAFAHRLAFWTLGGTRSWCSLLHSRCEWSSEWGPFRGHLLSTGTGRFLLHVTRRAGPSCPHTVEVTASEASTMFAGMRAMGARLVDAPCPAVQLACFNL